MKHFLLIVILSGFFGGVCSAEQTVEPNSLAKLTVEVSQGTTNGAAVDDDEVIVQIYQHEQPLQTLKGTVVDGKAVFNDVPTGVHVVAVARVRHQDMMFNGRPILLSSGQNEFTTSVQAFDVSYDKSKLSFLTHHLIIKAHSGFLEITEFMQLSNSSDMAISSKERDNQNRPVVLEMMLPKGFENLKTSSYFESNALVTTESGFYDIMAVPPGEYQLTFSYTLDVNSNFMDISRKITLPTSSFMVFTDLGQANLEGLDGAEKQTMSRNSGSMDYYKLSNLSQNDEVSFRITGFNPGTSGIRTWMILTVVFGILFVLVLLKLRSRKT